jgi:23S rRNA (adenine2030-N6)-methyltransferase
MAGSGAAGEATSFAFYDYGTPMNYRHAFHAGNFADCVKHALLVWLMDALRRKPAPVFVLDTHAGIGQYDLASEAALRTNEAREGILRLLATAPPVLARYLGLVRQLGPYPGSPVLIRALLRDADRMACCELHPEDAAALRRRFARDRQVSVHLRDGWEALGALLPPKEKRGLVLIDPPFEDPDEFQRLARGLRTGSGRFGHGVFAAWYPVKHLAPERALHIALRDSGIRDIVAARFCLREPTDPGRLNGCGLVVVNPPYPFETEASAILSALYSSLVDPGEGGGAEVVRLAEE